MELLAKSSFSFLHGASGPEELVKRAAELGHEAIAIPDHLGFYGSARAHQAAKKAGIRAIVGATLTDWAPEGGPIFAQLPVLVEQREGYRQLSQLLTARHCAPELPPPDTLTYSQVILTPESLRNPTKKRLLEAAKSLKKTFGDHNVSIALYRHQRRGEERMNMLLAELADHLDLPLLATNAPLYAGRQDRLLGDAFTCLREHFTLDDAGRRLETNAERHLKSPTAIHKLFTGYPQAVEHAYRLAERCEFTLENLGYEFPSYRDPDTHRLFTADEECELLRITAQKGLKSLNLENSKKHTQQIEYELSMIFKLGFQGYFLIVWDLVQFARSQGILCQGRGSAANSLVCYVLGITNVDPVAGGLLFERFLSENRKSWPDIDIDFPSGERREAVIQYVYQKYAPRGAAMTANVITYRPRSAFREMAKVLGFPESVANRFSELCASPKVHDEKADAPAEAQELSMSNYYPRDKVMEFAETIERSGVSYSHPRFKPLLHLYHAVLHSPRHLGQHSGGMIICDGGIDAIVPLQPATMPGRTVVQWDKDNCEDLGIVKVDLLGLGMLAAMEDAIHICRQRGHPVDLAAIPKDDPATYDLLCRADTVGTFQVESRAQMATLPIMQPREFYDVAIEVALIRPGPIVGDLVHPYLNRRTGREEIDYIHPLFEPILKRSLGVPIFQEQVLRMAMTIADFTGTEADELRRAMSCKRSDERMMTVSDKLRVRMTSKGIAKNVQEKVIHSIGSFALYGFPESHAISFALIAYSSCWLKVHRTAEFYCGLINNQPMGFYSVSSLMQDAKRHGVRCKAVCVINSAAQTTVIDDRLLRLGLDRIKGLQQQTIERLEEARVRGEFESLPDFLTRVRPNKKERRLLAAAGALNELPEVAHRRDALWQAERLPKDDLFANATSSKEKVLPQMTPVERLGTDLMIQGHSVGPHPMRLWRKEHGDEITHSGHLSQMTHGTPVRIAGLVICRQRPGTAKGHCFISLEDEYGIANLFVPKKTFHANRLTITCEPFLMVRGHVQISEGGQPTIYVGWIEALGHAPSELAPKSHDYR
ncbi:error-prone DNA polymerase [Akkermansiaceae bacterium]|nr:error-prone DNA polymerase [Akkermansiaceae bacterium]MDB4546587.1 error-prone DNA polymerase [Akkermansiaceae bacterium]